MSNNVIVFKKNLPISDLDPLFMYMGSLTLEVNLEGGIKIWVNG